MHTHICFQKRLNTVIYTVIKKMFIIIIIIIKYVRKYMHEYKPRRTFAGTYTQAHVQNIYV